MALEFTSLAGPLAGAIVGGALAFVGGVFSEPVRRRFLAPSLRLLHGEGLEFQTVTPVYHKGYVPGSPAYQEGLRKAIFIRVCAFNDSRHLASECRAYLVNIEKLDTDGSFRGTEFSDTIPLPWSCRDPDEYEPIAIPGGMRAFFSIVPAGELGKKLVLETSTNPFRYADILKTPGSYRFTVQVSSEEARPVQMKVRVDWTGSWYELRSAESK